MKHCNCTTPIVTAIKMRVVELRRAYEQRYDGTHEIIEVDCRVAFDREHDRVVVRVDDTPENREAYALGRDVEVEVRVK